MDILSRRLPRLKIAREGLSGWTLFYLALSCAACIFSIGIVKGDIRTVFVLFVLSILGVMCFRIERGVVALLIYLPFMGFLRRYMYLFNPWVEFDPILVVSDILVLFMFSYLFIFQRQAIFASLRRDPLVKIVTSLLLLLFLQIFNPLQGGIMAGLTGGKFYILPLLWFYLGLFARPRTVNNLLRIWVVIGAVVALYGLYQTFFGFANFEKYWIEWGGYPALRIGPHIRPFSTFVSAGEYAFFLMVSGTISFGLFLNHRSILPLLILALMVFALLMAAVRTALFGLGFSMLLLVLLQFKGRRRVALACAILLVIASLTFLVKTPHPSSSAYYEKTDIQAFLSRTYSGLADPFAQESTLWVRLKTWSRILSQVFTRNPLGYGIGTTSFGRKFGGLSIGTESDIVSFFASSGVLGGLLFLLLLHQFFRRSLRAYAAACDRFLLGTGIAIVGGFAIVGSFSLYATGPFTWLVMGALASLASATSSSAPEQHGNLPVRAGERGAGHEVGR